MKKYILKIVKKIYRESQNLIDFLLFFPFNLHKKSNFSKNVKKYGLLFVFPRKNSYFQYLANLSKDINTKGKINSSKSIISMGTCFAEQIHLYYSQKHFNYEKVSTNQFEFAANWGRITSIEHLLRLTSLYINNDIEKHIKELNTDKIDNEIKIELIKSFRNKNNNLDHKTNNFFIDLSREHLELYSSKSLLISSIKKHIKAAKKAISNSDTIFLTLGQTGYFKDRFGYFYAIKPSSIFQEFEPLEFIETDINNISKSIDQLEECINNLRKLSSNPNIFISLSPIPAFAYFGKTHKSILEYHWASKTYLYHVIKQVIARDHQLVYIPTFESVMSANLTSLDDDLRHLKTGFRNRMFELFFDS